MSELPFSHGIAHLSIVQGRREASSKTECVTQVLFGEHFLLLEHTEKWSRIRLAHDSYECWIEKEQYTPISAEEYEGLEQSTLLRCRDLAAVVVRRSDKEKFNITLGGVISYKSDDDFRVGTQAYSFHGSYLDSFLAFNKENCLPLLNSFKNTPYLWGGRTPFGADCSGFVQNIYHHFGYNLPRDAYQQAEFGTTVDSIDDVKFGDLAFFVTPASTSERISHVGFCYGDGKIIHAAGHTKVDQLDKEGIFDVENEVRSHLLRGIKRIVL